MKLTVTMEFGSIEEAVQYLDGLDGPEGFPGENTALKPLPPYVGMPNGSPVTPPGVPTSGTQNTVAAPLPTHAVEIPAPEALRDVRDWLHSSTLHATPTSFVASGQWRDKRGAKDKTTGMWKTPEQQAEADNVAAEALRYRSGQLPPVAAPAPMAPVTTAPAPMAPVTTAPAPMAPVTTSVEPLSSWTPAPVTQVATVTTASALDLMPAPIDLNGIRHNVSNVVQGLYGVHPDIGALIQALCMRYELAGMPDLEKLSPEKWAPFNTELINLPRTPRAI